MFETILFNCIKILTSSLELVFAFVLLSRFFEKKYEHQWLNVLAYIISTVAIVFLQEAGYLGSLKTFAEIIIIVIIASTLFAGKIREKIVFIALFSLMLSIAQMLGVLTLRLISEKIPLLPHDSFFYRVLCLEIPYVYMLFIVLLLSIFLKNKKLRIHIRDWLALLCVPVTVLITLTVYQFYIEQLPPNVEISYYIYISTVGLLFITVLTFTLFSKFQKQLYIAQNAQNLELQMSLQEQSIRRLEIAYNRTRELRHDLKNHLSCMYGLLNQEDYDGLRQYLNTMTDVVEDSTYISISENPAVDALLNEKLYFAQVNYINLQFEIESLHQTKAKAMDLCIILSNAIDNAIEACMKIEDKKERFVHIKILDSLDYTLLSITNPVNIPPIPKANGLFLSDKKDKSVHGIGLKSIKNTAEKYHGDFLAKYEDGFFTLIVKLNYSQN